MLAEQTPARYVAFDLLACDDEDAAGAAASPSAAPALERADPAPASPHAAHPRPRRRPSRGLRDGEGVVAKELGAPYRPGKRKGMVKVKRVRTIDAVVVGYRPGKEAGTVGSLILGLYDPDGQAAGRRPLLRAARGGEARAGGAAGAV